MPTTLARLKQGDLLLKGEINERYPIVDGSVKVRYIRDWINGSTANTGNHWVEIQAIDINGVNVALGKSVIGNQGNVSYPLSRITDGDTTSANFADGVGGSLQNVVIDLSDQFDLSYIDVWHYYADGRTYNATKTEVSSDGTTWYVLFNSAAEGTYAEASVGKRHYVKLGGLVAHFPFDGTDLSVVSGYLYDSRKTWNTTDYIDGKLYPVKNVGDYETVALEAEIYLESYPVSDMFTVLETSGNNSSQLYLSIDPSGKVAVYQYSKSLAGYHLSDKIIPLKTWTKVAVISTKTEFVIVVNNKIDKVISSTRSIDTNVKNIWIGSENSTRHFQGKIRNIKVGIKDIRPSINSSNTQTYDGLSVEEATTNLSDKVWVSYWNNSGTATWNITDKTIPNIPCPIYPVYSMKKDTTGNSALEWGTTTTAINTVYTFSTWFWQDRKGAGSNPYIRQYPANTNASSLKWDGNNSTDWNTWPQKQWIRLYGTFTSAANATYATFCTYINDAGDKIAFNGWQSEQKSFATSFVNGSRGEGDFKINHNILPKKRGTVVLDVTFHEDDTVNGLQGSDQYCFSNQGVYNAANTFVFHDTASWYIRSNDNLTSWSTNLNSNRMVREQRTKLVLVYDDTDGTLDIYKNGKLATDGVKQASMIGQLGNLASTWSHSGHAASTSYKMCQTIHSLSFYDRPLTAKEIRKLSGGFELTKEGNVLTNQLTEKPNSIPSDVVHIPLGESGKDEKRVIIPLQDTLIYSPNVGTYIGKSYTNLWNQKYNWSLPDTSPSIPISISTSSSGSYTLSALIRLFPEDTAVNPRTTLRIEYTDATIDTFSSSAHIKDGQYRHIVVTGTANSSKTVSKISGWVIDYSTQAGRSGDVKNIQITNTSYLLPFSAGITPYTRLNYTASNIGMNNNEFTFMLWIKYLEQGNWRLCGDWGRWYFGVSPSNYFNFSWMENSVNTGNVPQQRNSSYTPPEGVPLNKWLHIGVSVKENQFIDIYYNGVRVGNNNLSFYFRDAPGVVELNSISSGDTSYPLNAYAKNIMFVPRALTPTEVNAIYEVEMRQKNGLQIQGIIKEESL